MNDFQDQYRQTFVTFGVPLTRDDAVPEGEVRATEERIGGRLPEALRSYYLLAGREDRLNLAYNRLLPVGDLCVEEGHLVFMEENQAAVLWGVSWSGGVMDDPPVLQGVNGETAEWYPEHERLSTFLRVMLAWQAAYGGGLGWAAEAAASSAQIALLDQDWSFVGEVSGMRAYGRPGEAVCLLPWEGSPRIFAAAWDEPTIDRMAEDLGLAWEEIAETEAPPEGN